MNKGEIMRKLGELLKEARNDRHLTLEKVHSDTGITDSRLSRIERGELECPLSDLVALTKYYGVSSISLLLKAGFLNEDDIRNYQLMFSKADELNSKDAWLVQTVIDRLVQREAQDV